MLPYCSLRKIFLSDLQQFTGSQRSLFSDNGTNLVGAERIMREELGRLKEDGELTVQLKTLVIH
jgi:hypothetical protein